MQEKQQATCALVERYFVLRSAAKLAAARATMTDAALETHLASCEDCRAYAAAFDILVGAEAELARLRVRRTRTVVVQAQVLGGGDRIEMGEVQLLKRPKRSNVLVRSSDPASVRVLAGTSGKQAARRSGRQVLD
jgi:hypothetical protein